VIELPQVIPGLIILLIIDVFTVALRSAYLHPSVSRLLSQQPKSIRAEAAVKLLHSLTRLKGSLYLVLLIERLLFAGLVLLYLANLSSPPSLGLTILYLVLTAMLLFFVSWMVEDVVSRDPAGWAMRLVPYARGVTIVMSPLVWLPISWFGQTGDQLDNSSHLADELKTLVDAGEQEGVLEEGEGKMISSIFDMGNTLAREIMVPRIDILALDVSTPVNVAVDAFLSTGHSRLPVFEESIDNIIGLLYAKDLLRVWREGKKDEDLKELLRPAYFIPEAKKVNELLAELQVQRIHMAVVVDEYGGVAGLVTLEDIVEEILGEIQDEFDLAEELPFQKIGDDEYIFQGRIDLDDMNDILDSHIPKEDADTLGGYIYSRVGRIPSGGEEVRADNLVMTVETVSGRRIRKVHVQKIAPDEQNQEETANVSR
jgi:putative hemolysin